MGIDDSSTGNPKHENNSLRSKLEKEREKEFSVDDSSSKQFARAADVNKFLKLVKPLYGRNSKMCTDKIKLSDQVSTPLPSPFAQSRKQLEGNRGTELLHLELYTVQCHYQDQHLKMYQKHLIVKNRADGAFE
ncbi:hypothetical protein RND71_018247 [Anisodus tanguticus]|uniref:Uncharacterized protein n=1 Tax=Anisodus tanguticus TaxID=243964 RepID=A0AAE1S5S4_9SOLA|nr:hypothetical protein RND71_018247 [Anisodus tanguticus]